MTHWPKRSHNGNPSTLKTESENQRDIAKAGVTSKFIPQILI